MGNKSVDRAQMAKAAQQIDTKHQEIHKLQDGLRQEMEILKTRWTGRASDAFQQGYRSFDSEFEKVKQGLDTIHNQLVQTNRQYTAQEDENTATANTIAGLIG